MNRKEAGSISTWFTAFIATALLIIGTSFVVVKNCCLEDSKTLIEMEGVVALSLIEAIGNDWVITIEDIEGVVYTHRCKSFHEAFVLVEELRWRTR